MRTLWRAGSVVMMAILLGGCAEQSGVTTTPARPRGKELRVGVLLPLAGRHQRYAESTLRGLECAAGKQAPCSTPLPIAFITKDPGGDPGRAEAAVDELVTQEHVSVIIALLVPQAIEAAARKAQALRVPLISLSQREGIAEIGDQIFRLSVSVHSLVDTIARYAVTTRGFRRIAILYPANEYGRTYRSAFHAAATSLGASIVAEKSYGPEIANIIEARQQQEEEGTEGKAPAKPKRLPGMLTKGGEIIVAAGGAEEVAAPVVPKIRGADAVFIPDSYRNVLALLKISGGNVFGGATLLGVNLWNNAEFAHGDVDGAVFVDAFFRQSSDGETQRFVQTIMEAYHVEPTILEAQSFDAMRLLIRAAQSAHSRAPHPLREALAKLRNFHGVTGRISFNPEGDAERQLHLLTVRGGGIQEVEHAIRPAGQSRVRPIPTPRADRPLNPKYDVGGEAPLME